MYNTHEGLLNLPQLPPGACKTYLIAKMQSSLVSIGQLCDAGCIATFNKHHVFIKKDGELIRQGKRAETQQQDYGQPTLATSQQPQMSCNTWPCLP